MREKEIIEAIKSFIESAKQDYEESKEDANSYGHGYDTGRLVALKEVLELYENG